MTLYFIPKYQVPKGKLPVLSQEALVNLSALSSLSEKLKHLTSLLEITPEEYEERRAACGEILQIIRKFYPDSSLLMFGSSMNSLGIKGCDLDLLFLPFPSYCNSDFARGEEADKLPIPDPSSILSGKVSKDVLSKFDEFSHLKFIQSVLKQEKFGHRGSFIPAAKYNKLLLRIVVKSSKIACDISASNRLVVFSSELLQFFSKLDERVKPLVVCLRYWARSLGFIKRSFFSSYAFNLLVIFFLQTTNPPVLPSVQHLIKISGNNRMTEGWQTAFSTNVQAVPKSKNTENIGDLLFKFFDYYFHFDFLQYVVSTHYGKALTIKDIKNSKDGRMASFEVSSLNIQDVFILSRNVCKIEKLAIFKLALLTACEMLKDTEKRKFHMLFDSNVYQSVLDSHYFNCMSDKSQVCFIHLDYECMKKFASMQMWYNRASEAVYEVLQYGMLMECEVIDKVCSKKRDNAYPFSRSTERNGISNSTQLFKNNLQDKASTPYDLQLVLSIQCVLYSRTWIGRKNIEVTALEGQEESEVFADSVLGTEYHISKSLIKNNPGLSSPVPILLFKCDCYRHLSPQFSDLIVMLKPLVMSREFIQVSGYLTSYIPKTVKKMLLSN